jgi:hypothetical protein
MVGTSVEEEHMRQANYRIGWYIPHQIAALTHFHSDVTMEDFMAVVQEGQELLQDMRNEFHVIIDNRVVAMSSPAKLSQMKQMVSFMNHPLLRWVIVVKPQHLLMDTDTLPIEREGETQLKNVSSLGEAMSYLREIALDLQWEQADKAFFPDPSAAK